MKQQFHDLLQKYSFLLDSLFFYLSIGGLAIFWLSASVYEDMKKVDELKVRLDLLQAKHTLWQKSQDKENLFYEQIKAAHPQFLEKNLENLCLDEELAFSTNRSCILQEEEIRSFKKIEEVEIKLDKPIEVRRNGLLQLLSIIDGIKIPSYVVVENSPQIIIQDFQLTRKNHGNEEETYELDLRLIKRQKIPHS